MSDSKETHEKKSPAHTAPTAPAMDPRDAVLLKTLEIIEKLETKLSTPPEQKDQYLESLNAYHKARDERPHLPTEHVECVSPMTDATYTAVVTERPTGEKVVTNLLNYEYPAKVFQHQANGGSVPNNFVIMLPNRQTLQPLNERSGSAEQHIEEYLGWRWRETYQQDLQHVIGKPLHPMSRKAAQIAPAAV